MPARVMGSFPRHSSLPVPHPPPSSGDTVPDIVGDVKMNSVPRQHYSYGVNGYSTTNGHSYSQNGSMNGYATETRASPASSVTASDSLEIVGADMKELIEAMSALERLGGREARELAPGAHYKSP